MHPVAEQLLERHVEFELDAMTDQRIQPLIRATVQRCFELAEKEPLSAFATKRRCVGAFKRLAADAAVPRAAGEFAVALFVCFSQRLEATGVELEAVSSQDRFVAFVELVASLHEPRRRLMASLFRHPLYSELIASLVYKALLNYLIQDNVLSQRVPGVGAMLKLGRRVATRAVPGIDATLERQLRNYIGSYLPSLVRTSEAFVESLATDGGLEERAGEAWPEIGRARLAALTDGLTSEDAERVMDWSRAAWDELRRTEAFMDLGEALIGHAFERYGDQPLAVLLRDLGIKRGMVSRELLAFVPPLLKQLRRSGLLGELLRQRLTPFYESQAVSEILDAAAPR